MADKSPLGTATHGLRLIVRLSDVMDALPPEVRANCHILPHTSADVVICDIVSDESFEVLGHKSWISRKGGDLQWASVPIAQEQGGC